MTKRSLDQIKESLSEQFNKFSRRGDQPGPEMAGGSYGLGSSNRSSNWNPPSTTSPNVWNRGGKPIERPPGSNPPAAEPAPSASAPPNVWRKGEAPPKPAGSEIGSQVGKTPKKKLDEPVDLAKEFEKSSKPAVKTEKPPASPELSADKKDRMGRKEPSMTQNNQPELRADKRTDRIVEPPKDSTAPTWTGRAIGLGGTIGAFTGGAYLLDKYRDEKNQAEKAAAYKEIYGEEPPKPAPRQKSSVLEPADPDNPDYAPLKEATTTQLRLLEKYNNFLQQDGVVYEDRQDPRQVIEKYLGKRMSNSEYSAFLRTVGAEAGNSPLERAHVASVIINRAKAADGDIIGVLNTPAQFQAITGPNNKKQKRLSGNMGSVFNPYYPNARQIIPGIDQEIASSLSLVKNPKLMYFSSTIPAAYKDVGADTQHRLIMKQYKSDPNHSIVGKSIFATTDKIGPVRYNPNANFSVQAEKKLGDKFRDQYADLVEPTKIAQVVPSGQGTKPKKDKDKELKDKDKDKELKDRLARELAVSKQLDRPSRGSAKPTTPVKPANPTKSAAVANLDGEPNNTETKTHPVGTIVQPDYSKYKVGDLGPLEKIGPNQWRSKSTGKIVTNAPELDDLPAVTQPETFLDKVQRSLPPALGGKGELVSQVFGDKKKPAAPATKTAEPAAAPAATDKQPSKDSESSTDIERGKALDKIIRGVAGDLTGAPAADKRDEYYRQQLEKAKQEQEKQEKDKQEKARQDQEKQKQANDSKVVVTKQKKSKNKKVAASTEREPDSLTIVADPKLADLPKGGAAKSSPAEEPTAVVKVTTPSPEKIDVKDLATDQAGLAAANDTKIDRNAELVAQKQAEEARRKQEADRKAAEARAQAEADRLAAQERAQQELEANRQAAIERAKKAAPTPVQQTAAPDTGMGLKNIWDKGIEAFTGKQRVNLRDPRITLPESINTELQEILRLAGKKTKE